MRESENGARREYVEGIENRGESDHLLSFFRSLLRASASAFLSLLLGSAVERLPRSCARGKGSEARESCAGRYKEEEQQRLQSAAVAAPFFLHHVPACCWPPAPLLLLLATPRAESEQTSRRRRCAWRRSMLFVVDASERREKQRECKGCKRVVRDKGARAKYFFPFVFVDLLPPSLPPRTTRRRPLGPASSRALFSFPTGIYLARERIERERDTTRKRERERELREREQASSVVHLPLLQPQNLQTPSFSFPFF